METVLIDSINYSLDSLEKDCWVRLLNGALKYKDPLHNPAIANVNKHGVNMRTVVLRKVWTSTKQLAFNTDIRSGKWEDLKENDKLSWLFYDEERKLQIRISGQAVLHQNTLIADEAWTASSMSSRKIYMIEPGPSTITSKPENGLPAAFETADPSPAESEAGRKNFGTVITKVLWMEWLWLNSKGHRRAVFNYKEDGSFTTDWLIP